MPFSEENLRHLLEVSRLLAEIGTDFDAVLHRLGQEVTTRFGAGTLLELIGGDGRTLRPMGVYHPDPAAAALARSLAEQARSVVGEGLTGGIAASGHALLLPDIDADELRGRLTDSVRSYLDRFGVRSVVCVPLRTAEGTVGVLTAWRDDAGRPFTPRDAELLQTIADHAALAIVNARLYVRLQRTHAALENRTRALELALGELETFAWSVSHDLRAPLHTIQGFARALDEDYADAFDHIGREFLDRIQTGAERMNELIEALLDLSRLSRQEPVVERFDLSGLLHELVAEQRRVSGREVSTTIAPGLVAHGDPRLLRAVFGNLISNAWKFTASRAQPTLSITGAAQIEGVEIAIEDNGVGFDMAHAGRLFSPFQRLHSRRDFPGTGIGLAMAERIVRKHGGRIGGHGEPGHGARFTVFLPTPSANEADAPEDTLLGV